MEIEVKNKIAGAVLLCIYIGLSLCVELTSLEDASQNSELTPRVESTKVEESNILEGIALPIPPKVRKNPSVTVKRVEEEPESAPKYVKLPEVDGVKVMHVL